MDVNNLGGTLKILALEDDPADAKLLRIHLSGRNKHLPPVHLEVVESLAEAKARLTHVVFDAVLMDLYVGDSQGLNTFIELRKVCPTVPVIILSGLDDENIAVSAVKEGAQDYLPKSELDRNRIAKTISYAIERAGLLRAAVEGQQAAKDASRLKSEFLAHMSHEIRTPMNGVIGMTSLLGETALSAEQKQYVATIRRSGQVLLNIINEILDLSKIEAGKMQLESSCMNVRRAVEETLDLYAELAHRKGLTLASIVLPDVPTEMTGDSSRLRQILSNLVSNALKFTTKGQVTVRASLTTPGQHKEPHAGTDHGVWLRFEVSDTGNGIAQENVDHLFKAFSQIKASATGVSEGTGLGLTICKRLAELMDGEIGLSSEVGKGSTFWFTARFDSSPNHKRPRSSLDGKRLLVLSERPEVVAVVSEQINLRGLTSEAMGLGALMSNPFAALGHGKHTYDLVFCDGGPEGLAEPELAMVRRKLAEVLGSGMPLLTLQPLTVVQQRPLDGSRESSLKAPLKQSALYAQIARLITGEQGLSLAEDAPAQVSHAALAPAEAWLKCRRLLIADDSSVNRQVASHMAERLGFESDVVADGAEAVKAMGTVDYAAILMDCQMPEMDGFEATAKIRAMPGVRGKIPIVALTANVLKEYTDRCLASGMDSVLTKPILLEDLRAVFGAWGPFSEEADTPAQPLSPSDKEMTPVKPKVAGVIDPRIMDAFYSSRGAATDSVSQFLNELIDLFIEIAPPEIAKLRIALDTANPRALEHHAHKLKGSCRNIGAVRVADICEKLEDLGTAKAFDGAQDLLVSLQVEYEKAAAELVGSYKKVLPASA